MYDFAEFEAAPDKRGALSKILSHLYLLTLHRIKCFQSKFDSMVWLSTICPHSKLLIFYLRPRWTLSSQPPSGPQISIFILSLGHCMITVKPGLLSRVLFSGTKVSLSIYLESPGARRKCI